MSMLTLSISYLTTSNLPWFMGLTFQVPMQYCSLRHQTLLPSPISFTIGCRFCFGSISSFFLQLVLHWTPVAYWASTDLGSSSFSVLSFCLFILFLGFSRQKCWFCYTKINVAISRKNMTALPNFSPNFHSLFKGNGCILICCIVMLGEALTETTHPGQASQ